MYKPLYGNHAIENVVFRLAAEEGLSSEEETKLDRVHTGQLKTVLPRKDHPDSLQIWMGPGKPLTPPPLRPTRFLEFTREGKAAWWLDVDGPQVAVVCSDYSGWKSIRRKAYSLFSGLGRGFADELRDGHPITSVKTAELTYENMFVWEGQGTRPEPRETIRDAYIPEAAEGGMEWHNSQGWIVDPRGKRILERFQVAGVEAMSVQDPRITKMAIRVTVTVMWGLGAKKKILDLRNAFRNVHAVDGSTPDGKAMYDEMHKRAHELLRGLITEDMAGRIGLPKGGRI